MTIHAHIGLETATSLLHAYDFVAREHRRTREIANSAHPGGAPKQTFDAYSTTFTLLTLNAAVIEGSMRSILSAQLLADRRSAMDAAKLVGRTGPTRAERLVELFHVDVESNGGWENLKRQYVEFLDVKFADLIDDQGAEAVETIFTLRNVFAHGTALIQPKNPMQNEDKEAYPFKWQSKLQRATVFLDKNFGRGDIFKNLGDDGLPEFFFKHTQALFERLKATFDLPKNVEVTVDAVRRFRFGYRNFG